MAITTAEITKNNNNNNQILGTHSSQSQWHTELAALVPRKRYARSQQRLKTAAAAAAPDVAAYSSSILGKVKKYQIANYSCVLLFVEPSAARKASGT